MSDFDDFNDEALSESFDIIGREDFTIAGIDEDFAGILNEFTCDRELTIGGKVGTYTATLLCVLAEFVGVDGLNGPLERALEGKRVAICGRDLVIATASHDGSSLTLGLANPAKHR